MVWGKGKETGVTEVTSPFMPPITALRPLEGRQGARSSVRTIVYRHILEVERPLGY